MWKADEPAGDALPDEPPDEPPSVASDSAPDFTYGPASDELPHAAMSAASATDAEREADVADDVFAALLGSLRTLPGPCSPPIGEGAFDILYASAHEIVVWFASAREGIAQREVVIPARLARRAWGVLLRGAPVDETALQALAAGPAGGRWLLALFAQLPDVEVRAPSSADAASPTVTLRWRGQAGAHGDV